MRPRFHLEAFGASWRMGRPRVSESEAQRLLSVADGERSAVMFHVDFLLAHSLDATDLKSAMEDDDVEAEWLDELVGLVIEAAYNGLPLSALLTLWALWPERSHLVHGQLLAAGNPSGADELDLYDVACLVWAFLDEAVTASEFTARRLAESSKLRDRLLGTQGRPEAAQAEVDEFRALLNRNAKSDAQGDAEVTSSTTGGDDPRPEPLDGTSHGSD